MESIRALVSHEDPCESDARLIPHDAARPAEERRRFARSRRRMACVVRCEAEVSKGSVIDVSGSGLLLQANLRPATGSTVHVELSPTAGEPFSAMATVVRIEPSARPAASGLALELVSAPEEYFQLLAAITATPMPSVHTP